MCVCVCVRECVRKIIITVGHGPSVENIHSDHAVPLPSTPFLLTNELHEKFSRKLGEFDTLGLSSSTQLLLPPPPASCFAILVTPLPWSAFPSHSLCYSHTSLALLIWSHVTAFQWFYPQIPSWPSFPSNLWSWSNFTSSMSPTLTTIFMKYFSP